MMIVTERCVQHSTRPFCIVRAYRTGTVFSTRSEARSNNLRAVLYTVYE